MKLSINLPSFGAIWWYATWWSWFSLNQWQSTYCLSQYGAPIFDVFFYGCCPLPAFVIMFAHFGYNNIIHFWKGVISWNENYNIFITVKVINKGLGRSWSGTLWPSLQSLNLDFPYNVLGIIFFYTKIVCLEVYCLSYNHAETLTEFSILTLYLYIYICVFHNIWAKHLDVIVHIKTDNFQQIIYGQN